MAITNAPNKMLSLSEIYHYFATEYPDVCNDESETWKNSIRHYLSIKGSCFEKIPKHLMRPSIGHYWTIRTNISNDKFKGKIVAKKKSKVPVLEFNFTKKPNTYEWNIIRSSDNLNTGYVYTVYENSCVDQDMPTFNHNSQPEELVFSSDNYLVHNEQLSTLASVIDSGKYLFNSLFCNSRSEIIKLCTLH